MLVEEVEMVVGWQRKSGLGESQAVPPIRTPVNLGSGLAGDREGMRQALWTTTTTTTTAPAAPAADTAGPASGGTPGPEGLLPSPDGHLINIMGGFKL